MSGVAKITASIFTVLCGAFVTNHFQMERRAEFWRAEFERVPEVQIESATARFGGCGWALGETVTLETKADDGSPMTIRMCRNRDGSGRIDFISYSSMFLGDNQ